MTASVVAVTTFAFRDAALAAPGEPRAAVSTPAPRARQDDSARVHRELRDAIRRFQDSWRKAWQQVEIRRHRPINLEKIRGWPISPTGEVEQPIRDGDRANLNLTPDLRRYLAILCYVDTPTDLEIEAVKSRMYTDIGIMLGKARPTAVGNARGRRQMSYSSMRGSGGMSGVSFATPRRIEGSVNSGAVCPSWTPDTEPLPLDEGESIDLALPPRNREPLRKQREGLIRQLEAAHARFPQDGWIAGQRLRFVLDQRAPERAIAAARACRGDGAWCAALLGLAQEHAGDIPAAESSYRAADSLAAAGTGQGSCIDAETLLLFAPRDRADIEGMPCPEQRAIVERLWWLADPLWSVAGNERYVAHHSRRTHVTVRAALHRDERYIWDERGGGTALREMLVRYGWPAYTYWPGVQLEEEMNKLREDPRKPRVAFPPYTAKEYTPDRTALIPSFAAIRDPFDSDSADWDLRYPAGTSPDLWWPQEHMMLWTRLEPLSRGQQVQWRRDTSLGFAMAVDDPLLDLDTTATGPSAAVLTGSAGPDRRSTIARTQVETGGTLRFHGGIPSAPLVLSAEILGRTRREPARRIRHGLRPPPSLREMGASDVALSDPVFMRLPDRNTPAPTDLPGVLALMAGDVAFARTEPLALYWESYGFRLDDTLQFAMHVVSHENVGAVRRLGAALGIASDLRDSIGVTWTEPDSRRGAVIPTAGKSAVGRAIAVDLRSLAAGSYVVSLEVRGRGAVARSERRFTVTEQ